MMATRQLKHFRTSFLNNYSKLFINYFIYLFLIYVISGVGKACEFPRYLETEGNMWMARNNEKGTFNGYFRGNMLIASRCDTEGNCFEYQRKCLLKSEDDKYEVQHNSKGGNKAPMFLCMKILQRGTSIIQIRESQELAFRSPNACNDNHLILDNWLMMTIDNFSNQKIPCPFSGGYHIRFQNSEKQPICNKVINPGRLESECEQGDGMSLNFLEPECLEKGLEMKVQQSLFCAASWSHGNFTFVVLRPQDGEFKAWCMRIPGTDMNRPIRNGILFIDLVCDPGDEYGNIRETSNYVHLEFERRVISSTCAEAYSTTCSDKRLCNNMNENYNRNCRKFCDYCYGEPSSCTFPAALQGEWLENQCNMQSKVEISWYDMAISAIGRFKCHESDGFDFENNTLLVQTFDNGCFPRYACFESRKPFSSILEYRLGNRVPWPVDNFNKLKDIVCAESQFEPNAKDKEIFGKSIEEKPSKILVDMHHHFPVSCQLDGWPGFKDSRLYLQELNVCEYCLVHEPANRNSQTKFITQQLNCTADGSLERRDYHCLGVFVSPNTKAVVTRTLHVHQEYLCWVFIQEVDHEERAGIVYVLDATNCNTVAINAVREGSFEPKKTFIIPKKQPRPCPYLGPLTNQPTTDVYKVPPQRTPLKITDSYEEKYRNGNENSKFRTEPTVYSPVFPDHTGRPYPQQDPSLQPPLFSLDNNYACRLKCHCFSLFSSFILSFTFGLAFT